MQTVTLNQSHSRRKVERIRYVKSSQHFVLYNTCYVADAEYSISGSEDDFDSPASPGHLTSRKSGGIAKFRSKFNPAWKEQYPFVNEVQTNMINSFYCTISRCTTAYFHINARTICKRHDIKDNFCHSTLSSPISEKIMRAELKVATMLVRHNILLAVADELTPLSPTAKLPRTI